MNFLRQPDPEVDEESQRQNKLKERKRHFKCLLFFIALETAKLKSYQISKLEKNLAAEVKHFHKIGLISANYLNLDT